MGASHLRLLRSDVMLGDPHVVSFGLDSGSCRWEPGTPTLVPCGFFPEMQAYGTCCIFSKASRAFILCPHGLTLGVPELQNQRCPRGEGKG